MPNFKMASRSLDELKSAKAELNEMFSVVRGARGSMNPKGMKKLEESRFEIAEVILQLINDTVLVTDPTPFLVEHVDGQLGVDLVWQQLNSVLRVVNRSYGTRPTSQRLIFKEFGMVTSHKEVNVAIPLEEIAVGRLTASQIVDEMAFAINRYRISTILAGIDAGVPAAADRTGKSGYTLRYTDLTQSNLDHAIDGVLDESESPTVFGRHIALAPKIRGFTGWSVQTLYELEVRGMIGTYHNAKIVTLRDQAVRRDANAHLIASNKAYIGSGTPGAKFQSKDVSFLDYTVIDQRTSTFEIGTRIEDGVLVWDPYQYRIIENIT